MEKKEKKVLGIDVGISSCGWGILEINSGEVVAAGVRLFGEGDSKLNEERRGHRSSRRLLRRRKHRLERLETYLLEEKIVSKEDIIKNVEELSLINPYEIRVKGIKEKLSKKELFIALRNITKHRGSDNIQIIEENAEGKKEQGETKKILSKNKQLLQNKFVCEIQLDRLNKEKSLRGIDNKFTTEDYIKEVKKILSFQDISENQIKNICEIISKRRAYYDGPGSEKSPTPYGRWFYDENGVIKLEEMIEKMRGKCSIYPSKERAPKMSYSAHLFNFLNEVNNLRYGDNQKVTSEQKLELVKQNIEGKTAVTPKKLAKVIGVNVEDIKGFPIKKNGDVFLSPFIGVNAIKKALKNNPNIKDILKNIELLDEIAEILTDHKSVEKRIEKLNEYKTNLLDENDIKIISNLGGFIGYHSLSLKAIKELLDDLQNTSDNQMQIIWKSGIGQNNLDSLKGKKQIPFDEDKVYSPVAKRAQREAIKIINAVRKEYGEMDSIVIEMPRDKNSEEQSNNEKKRQKKYSAEKAKVDGILTGYKIKVNAKTKLKIRLYLQQEEKCVYSGDKLDLSTLINDESVYEIDHIIPLSVSYDDSLANKVLCTHDENQKKGQQTPYAYFKSGKASRSFENFKKDVLAIKNFNRKKREYLLMEEDVSKYENQKKFINRNLVDTRYASKALLNMVQNYMKANDIDTKVHTVRGGVTSSFRKKAHIKKSRDEDYSHHAIDALIVAGIKKMKFIDNVLNTATQEINGEIIRVDRITGEILTPENEKEYFDSSYINLIKNLRDKLDGKIKYSHKIDKKPNREISKEKIYSIRNIEGEDKIIEKYSDIYGESGEKVAKLFREEVKGKLKAEKLLMYKNDKVTYNLLKKICDSYEKEKNPFAAYYRDNGDYIRKCDNKKGPIIKSLRYDSKRLGSYQDISHKYPKGNKVVKLFINTYRVDMYKNQKGEYKFMRVIYSDILQNKKGYSIDINKYNAEKNRRKISQEYTFQFSLYKGDLFGYIKGEDKEEIVKYNGMDYNVNRIQYKKIEFNDEKSVSIGKSIKKITKYSTDILGNRFKSKNSICKMEVGMI